MAEPRRVALQGSERAPLPGARPVGPSDAQARLEVTLHLRPRAPLPDMGAAPDTRLSREELGERHGADPDDVAAAQRFAAEHGLDVVSTRPERRSVVLGGSVAQMSRAFGVTLETWEHPGGAYRGRIGPLHLPADLARAVEGVFGLDDRPQTRPHFRPRIAKPDGAAKHAPHGGFTPPQVARLYDFPTHLDGSGQTIAVLEVSGGYRREDLDAYFASLHLPSPDIEDVLVDTGQNAPTGGGPDSDDGEVLLDIEVVGAVAPRAKLVVYWTPNTERGFIDAFSSIVHDTARRPSVLTVSWGSAESTWTRQALRSIDGILQGAAAVGMTVLVASGDDGSGDGVADGRAHVDFPASSPHVVACGGTRVHLHQDGRMAAEEAWDDRAHQGGCTGGGISEVFAVPPWQQAAHLPPCANPGAEPGRGVPDVAGDADPDTGYRVRVDGVDTVLGGTSAVAPLWAGLVALANQHHRRPVGFLNPRLYGPLLRAGALRDVPHGANGAYSAAAGWDCCTGLGTPLGSRLVEALRGGHA